MSDLEKLFYGNDLIEVVAGLPKEVETLSGKRILIAGAADFSVDTSSQSLITSMSRSSTSRAKFAC